MNFWISKAYFETSQSNFSINETLTQIFNFKTHLQSSLVLLCTFTHLGGSKMTSLAQTIFSWLVSKHFKGFILKKFIILSTQFKNRLLI